MTNISIYDSTAKMLEDYCDMHDATIAEVIDSLVEEMVEEDEQ
jgi:hypothetical protein